MALFRARLDGWESWRRLFRSLPAFEGLVRGILRQEGLPADGPVTAAGPGTNAVFRAGRAGELVVKIFAPPESGIDASGDFEAERYGLERAARLGVAAPVPRAAGVARDRYRFAYLVTAFQPGREAGAALRENGQMSGRERRAFVRRLRESLDRLSGPPLEEGETAALLHRRAEACRSPANRRWARLPASLQAQRLAWLRDNPAQDEAYVHGDVCGDNVLIAPDGRPVLIDFADAVAAPRCYDYPPILFDLFAFDPELCRLFRGTRPPEEFARDCLTGLFLHGFGQELLEAVCGRLLSCPLSSLDSFRPVAAAVCSLVG